MRTPIDEARKALSTGQHDRVIELVLEFAEAGDPDAQEVLALSYWGTGRFEEAERWFLKASDAGHGGASHNLGVLYQTGWPGRAPDLEKFRYYLQRAYDAGYEHRVASDPLWWKR
jgi:TPR repeat protein